MWLFPYATYATIGAILAVLAAMAFTESLASQLYASLLCVAIVIAAYFVIRRRHATSPEAQRSN
jgi:GABA permease